MQRLDRRVAFAFAFGLPLVACGTASVTYVTPWLRETTYKEASFDSGGRVHLSVEVLRGGRWTELRGGQFGVAMAGGRRVAVRMAGGSVFIVGDDGAIVPVPSCEGRSATVSPDRRRVVCFERGLLVQGFVDDVLFATGESEPTRDTVVCRLVYVRANGETVTETQVAHYPPGCAPTLWDSIVDRTLLTQGFDLY